MAGSSSNWFKVSAGPLKGKTVYLTKAQQMGYARPAVLAALNKGKSTVIAKTNTQLPAGMAKKKLVTKPTPPPSAPVPPHVAKAKAKAQSAVEKLKAKLAAQEEFNQAKASGQGIKSGKTDVPVSSHLPIQSGTHLKTRAGIEAALSAIDSVHADGTLPKITIKSNTSHSTNGQYVQSSTGAPYGIRLSQHGDHPAMSTAHETGHFLDFQALTGKPGSNASKSNPDLKNLMDAIDSSAAIGRLKTIMDTGQVSYTKSDGTHTEYKAHLSHANYLNSPHEKFARAYAQYIATKSGNKQMQTELTKEIERAQKSYPHQWTHEDFAPIAAQFDALFKSKGWAK